MISNRVSTYSVVFITLLTSAVFFGCGGDSSTASNTISFWHFYSEPSQKQALTNLIAEFEKQNNCKVELQELSWNDGKTKLMTAFNAKQAPDVLELGSDWVAQFSSSGVLAELPSTMTQEGSFLPWTLPLCSWNGKSYALPWTVDTRVLYVNKDILENNGISTIPETIDELQRAAEAIAQNKSTSGFTAVGPNTHVLYKRILPFFWSYGGEVFAQDGTPVLASDANVKALTKYVELSRTGTVDIQKKLDVEFTQGKSAFWISGGWLSDKIRNENPLLNYQVVPMPMFNSTPGVSFAGGEYLTINAQSKKQELARKLLTYLTNADVALGFCKQVIEAGFPASTKTYNDSFYASHPIRSVFAKQLQNAKMTPVHSQWLEIEAIIENAVVEALYAKKSPQDALIAAQDQVTQFLAKTKMPM